MRVIRTLVSFIVVCLWTAPTCLAQKPYWNETWNYCVNYPPGWSVRHAVDQYGMEFTRASSVSMSFGVTKDNETLQDNFRTAYLTDEHMNLVERRDIRFQEHPAIIATLSSDSLRKVQRVMTVADPAKGVIYEFKLAAPDLPTLKRELPTFNAELASFKFSCK